jgi:peroxiredoxin Q/BCP
MTIAVGDTLPDFSLPTDDGGTITASELRGRPAVLYFYPKDDTPGCTRQAQDFRDALSDYEAAGVRLVGISTDSVASHDKFKSKHALNFTLASDADRRLAEALGVWVEKRMYGKTYMGMERATFFVDAEGVVRQIWRKVKVAGHAAEVLAAARQLLSQVRPPVM